MSQTFVLYRSSFAYENAPNISHVTVDGVKTLCGRLVSKAATVEPDLRDDEPPDCNSCFRVWFYSRQK